MYSDQSFKKTETKKKLIFVLPSSSQLIIRLVMRCFQHAKGTFSLYIFHALTPSDYSIKVFNHKILWLKRDFTGGNLVAISCATSNSYEAYKVADRFRKAGSTVIMGGVHVSYFPEEALQHCDSVVIGEAESIWGEVIRDYENKSLKKIYHGVSLEDYFSLSYDYYMKLDPRILYSTGILLSRGCKYRCEFCVPPLGKVRFIKLEEVVALLKRIKENIKLPFGMKPLIIFRDYNIFSDPAYAKSLFKEMKLLGLRWSACSSIDIAFDDEALRLAHEGGCRHIGIGFETIYPEKMPKTSISSIRSINDYRKAIRKIKSHGIRVSGGFIVGFDYYTHIDYLKLIFFITTSGLYNISATILTPYPGSQLYERLKKEDRITTFEWRKYDTLWHVVFKPKNMSAMVVRFWFIIVRLFGLLFSPWFIQMQLVLFISYYFSFVFTDYILGRFISIF